jgi:predicted negative regulator of RcsB-dependent stress response
VEDLSEKEQIEQMRAWWSEYGRYVIGGVVVGIGLMVGVGQYRSQTVAAQTEASTLYEAVFEAVADGDTTEAETAATNLHDNYANTVYSSQVRLTMARHYMDKGRDQDAANELRAIVDEAPDSELGLIARLRLAKVLLYQDKALDVVDLLSNKTDNAFAARYSEALGDAYVSLAQYEDARDAYALAMADSATMPTVDRVLVQMKVDDLPVIVETAAVAENPADDAPTDSAPADEEPTTDGDGTSE